MRHLIWMLSGINCSFLSLGTICSFLSCGQWVMNEQNNDYRIIIIEFLRDSQNIVFWIDSHRKCRWGIGFAWAASSHTSHLKTIPVPSDCCFAAHSSENLCLLLFLSLQKAIRSERKLLHLTQIGTIDAIDVEIPPILLLFYDLLPPPALLSTLCFRSNIDHRNHMSVRI